MLILGHRGVIGDTISQNSMRAFREALKVADGFETDACPSQEGEVFLIHESNTKNGIRDYLDFASAEKVGERRMAQMTSAEIAALRLKDGQPIPTLREALRLAGAQPGKVINVELKSYGATGPVLKVLQDMIWKKLIVNTDIIVSSFHHQALLQVREDMPALTIGALVVDDSEDGQPLFPFDGREEARGATYVGLTQALQSRLLKNKVKPDCFVMPEKMLTKDNAQLVVKAFKTARLCGWTVTENADYDQADLLQRLKTLRSKTDTIAAVIVDKPREFKEASVKFNSNDDKNLTG